MEMPTRHPEGRGDWVHSISEPQRFRLPQATDGTAVHDLIARCPPLDTNSLYCNLLQCTHFAKTCVIAEINNGIGGWVSGHIRPDDPSCLFIWQVAVAPEARGRGLAKRMILEILQRDACRNITRIESTITEANHASWSLFQNVADDLGVNLKRRIAFDAQPHFAGRYPTEHLVDIGPLHADRSGR